MTLLRLTLSFMFVLSYVAAWAQGRVVDERGTGIEYATVAWQALPDSTLLKVDVADSAGRFATADVPMPVLFTIMAPGFTTYTTIVTNDKQYQVKLATDAHVLNAVTVSTNKRVIERKADRTVFNVESSVAATGSDAYDVLKRAPGVTVGNNSSISIAGKSTVSIMMNDKLLQMTGEELEGLLRSIPASNISKIEVITAPPSRYDAQGNTGIINIVTKKSLSDGFNGSVSATYQQRKRASQVYSGNFNYRHGKLNVFGSANINSFQFTSPQNITTYYETQKQEQVLEQYNDPVYSMFQLGADYSLNKSSTIGLQLFRGYVNKDMDQYYDIRVVRLPQQILDSTIHTYAYNNEEGWRQTGNLNYEWRIDTTGKKLNIDADYFYRVNERGRNFETVNFFTDGRPTGVRQDDRTEGLQDIDIRSVKADLVLPYKWATLSVGGKISSVKNTSANQFLHRVGSGFLKDYNLSNEFKYTENTQAAYVSAQKAMGKIEAQAGLRYEQTQTEGVSITINQTNTNRYDKLFPTAYVTYTPNEDNVFNINYSRRIDRPNFYGMNPFRQYITPNSYEAGNPFLQPSFSDNMELGYTYKSKYIFTLYAIAVQALSTRVSQVDKVNNAYNFTVANAGSSKNAGMSATANITPAQWWECNMQVNGFYNVFNSTYYTTGNVRYESFGMYAQINNTFPLNYTKTLLAELGYNYTSRQIDDFDIQLPNSNLSAGIKAMLMNKKLVVAVTANDILRTDLWRMNNQFNGTQQSNYHDSRSLFLSLTWKFGNTNVKGKRERSTGADESGRA